MKKYRIKHISDKNGDRYIVQLPFLLFGKFLIWYSVFSDNKLEIAQRQAELVTKQKKVVIYEPED